MPAIHSDLCSNCGRWTLSPDEANGWIWAEDDDGSLHDRLCPDCAAPPRRPMAWNGESPSRLAPGTSFRVAYGD